MPTRFETLPLPNRSLFRPQNLPPPPPLPPPALLPPDGRSRIGGIVGHSVGEFTAAVGAGVLSPADAMHAVAVRGQAMADASALTPTGMSAWLSTDRKLVLARITKLDLAPANINGGGQIVAAGAIPALTTLKE